MAYPVEPTTSAASHSVVAPDRLDPERDVVMPTQPGRTTRPGVFATLLRRHREAAALTQAELALLDRLGAREPRGPGGDRGHWHEFELREDVRVVRLNLEARILSAERGGAWARVATHWRGSPFRSPSIAPASGEADPPCRRIV